jgi:hypothetical protein
MASQSTAPCPHCKAENFAHRRECWRCKRTLPTSFALDARDPSIPFEGVSARQLPKPDRAAIEEAISKAIVYTEHDTEEGQFAYGSGSFGKRLIWMLRRRSLLN